MLRHRNGFLKFSRATALIITFAVGSFVLGYSATQALTLNTNSITTEGTLNLKTTANSTTAFQVQKASGVWVFTVDTVNGRVGVGNVTPSYLFHVSTQGEEVAVAIHSDFNQRSAIYFVDTTNSTDFALYREAGTRDLSLWNYAASQDVTIWRQSGTVEIKGPALFKNSSNSTTALQVQNAAGTSTVLSVDTTNQRVGIGTTSPGSKLEVENTTGADDVLLLEDSSGVCEAQPTTTGLTWSCSSDSRFKKDIRKASNVLDYIVGIPLKDYTVTKTGEVVTGPIAQDLLVDYPELVKQGDDGYYRVSELSQWTLVKAIQELRRENMEKNNLEPLLRAPAQTLEKLPDFVEKTGLEVKDKVVEFKEIFIEKLSALEIITDRLKAKSVETEVIQIKDRATGEPYCTWIENGEWRATQGECSNLPFVPQASGTTPSAITPSGTAPSSVIYMQPPLRRGSGGGETAPSSPGAAPTSTSSGEQRQGNQPGTPPGQGGAPSGQEKKQEKSPSQRQQPEEVQSLLGSILQALQRLLR